YSCLATVLSAGRRRRAPGARRRRAGAGPKPDRRIARPHRIGQIDVAAPDCRLGATVERDDYLSWRAGARAGAGYRDGLSVLRVVSLADGAGKRPARFGGARPAGA